MWMDYLLQSASISKVECGLGGGNYDSKTGNEEVSKKG